jgi:predicted SnoaL-like aldol condensation-catalyzing enzyme
VTYDVDFLVSEGDLVMVHGRYTGIDPKPMIAVDIFRIVEGRSKSTGTCSKTRLKRR